jgi:hypothetical protein
MSDAVRQAARNVKLHRRDQGRARGLGLTRTRLSKTSNPFRMVDLEAARRTYLLNRALANAQRLSRLESRLSAARDTVPTSGNRETVDQPTDADDGYVRLHTFI